jgi:molybdopterin synthase sulfur carrier subunit
MIVRVQLFAAAKDSAGRSPVRVELPDAPTVRELRHALVTACPQLTALAPVLLVAVNASYATDDQLLQPDDEIACFPPVSGG